MTRTFRYVPLWMNCAAVMSPITKPLHAAVRSNAAAPLAPISACTWQALPKRSSGLEVASSTRSMSSAATPERWWWGWI